MAILNDALLFDLAFGFSIYNLLDWINEYTGGIDSISCVVSI